MASAISDWEQKMSGASCLVLALAIGMVVTAGGVSAASDGAKIFMMKCSGCHAGGKNLINPKFPIIGSKKLASKAVFKAFLIKPAPPMTPFPKIANNDADLTALYEYCKTLK